MNTAISEKSPSPGSQQIISACARLRTAEKLLLNPSPLAIENAGFVLHEALSLTKTWKSVDLDQEKDLAEFQALCVRVKALLEGAHRAQWTYIHRIGSATQTYTAGPGAKTWIPRVGSLSIQA